MKCINVGAAGIKFTARVIRIFSCLTILVPASTALANVEVVSLQETRDYHLALLRWKYDGERWKLSYRRTFPGFGSSAYTFIKNEQDQVPLVAAWGKSVAFTCSRCRTDGVLLERGTSDNTFIPYNTLACPIRDMRFSFDGRYLFLISNPELMPRTVACYRVSTGKRVVRLVGDFAYYTGHSLVYLQANGSPSSYPLGGNPMASDSEMVKTVGRLLSEYKSPRLRSSVSRDRVAMAQDVCDARGAFLLVKRAVKVQSTPYSDEMFRDIVISPRRGVVASMISGEELFTYARFQARSYLVFWKGSPFAMEKPHPRTLKAGIYGLDLRSGKLKQLAPLDSSIRPVSSIDAINAMQAISVNAPDNLATTVVEGLKP